MARIKISKVAKDLNIALPTVIEFLQSKGINIDMNPNSRIDEDAYNLLVAAYSSDKAQKSKSEKLSSDRQKERAVKPEPKAEPEAKEIKIPTTTIKPKVVGHIDLDAHGKPVKKSEPEPKAVETPKPEPKVEPKPEPKPQPKPEVIKPEPKVVETPKPEPKAEPKPEPKPQPKAEPKPEKPEPAAKPVQEPRAEVKPEVKKAEAPAPKEEPKPQPQKEPVQDEPAASDDVFTMERTVSGPQLNVIGKIDLSAINQQTRPKKKSKEERRNERIAKDRAAQNAQGGAGAQQSGDRKKRRRIGKEKVDIEKTSNQQPSQRGGDSEKGQGGGSRHERNRERDRDRDRDRERERERAPKSKERNKRPIHAEANEEDVQKQVKEVLARLTNKDKGQKKGAKWRKEKREAFQSREREAAEMEAAESKVLKLTEFVTANDLAVMMDVPINNVIATCMNLGVMVSINQRLDAETINIVAEEFGYKTEYVSAEVVEAIHQEEDDEDNLTTRPPIVTVMGHVDHGKTSLLDYIRNANVIAGEAGGITQHIGAYNVKLGDGRRVTFLDTPGHEAFTAMRARGAKATDIAIIIVAADDNVMPQTKEAINHAMAAGVPIVFAINKIDKPTANPDKIKEELAAMNFLVEEWGGKYQSQDISAKKGIGVPELMEKVLLEAEMLELKANPNRRATGSIIESSLDKGRGYVATVLVSNGTLKMGDIVLAGTSYGKVKAMFNERNQRMKEAGPSTPALILGLNGAPAAGDTFHVIETEQEAREIANKREQLQREQGLRTQKMLTLDEVGRRLALGDFHELNVIVKGDVDGSVEALSDSLIKLSTEQVQVNVIHKGVGQISESDVSLAAASDAIIVGFQVRPSGAAAKLAEQEGVDIRKYSVIYDAIEEVKAAMEGMLAPTLKEQVTATIEVREVFNITKVGLVAGAMVKTGKVKRSDKARLIRDGIVIFTGAINALKRFKDDVKEVGTNFECGISLTNCNDIKVGDIIESYEEIEVKQTL